MSLLIFTKIIKLLFRNESQYHKSNLSILIDSISPFNLYASYHKFRDEVFRY